MFKLTYSNSFKYYGVSNRIIIKEQKNSHHRLRLIPTRNITSIMLINNIILRGGKKKLEKKK